MEGSEVAARCTGHDHEDDKYTKTVVLEIGDGTEKASNIQSRGVGLGEGCKEKP
jgi:hypothetical protein